MPSYLRHLQVNSASIPVVENTEGSQLLGQSSHCKAAPTENLSIELNQRGDNFIRCGHFWVDGI
eukprot:6148341-Karenia_brevis.AAC.1